MYERALFGHVCACLRRCWTRALVLGYWWSLFAVGVFGCGLVSMSAYGVRAACDVLDRCCGVSVVCSMFAIR